MYGRLFLKEIRIVIKYQTKENLQQMQILIQNLRDRVSVCEADPAETLCAEKGDRIPGEGKKKKADFREGEAPDRGILWLTDCAETARRLLEQGEALIFWLHEDNRDRNPGEVLFAVEEPGEADAEFFDRIYRRYREIPWVIAETERCIVRESTEEDVESFVKIYGELQDAGYRVTEEFCHESRQEREYVRKYIRKFYEIFGYGIWTVVWKDSGEVIGRVGFEHSSDEREEALMLGYMTALPWQRKGIAEEVCRAALSFARAELEVCRIGVKIDAENVASLRLAQKLGFEGSYVTAENGSRQYLGSLAMTGFHVISETGITKA